MDISRKFVALSEYMNFMIEFLKQELWLNSYLGVKLLSVSTSMQVHYPSSEYVVAVSICTWILDFANSSLFQTRKKNQVVINLTAVAWEI